MSSSSGTGICRVQLATLDESEIGVQLLLKDAQVIGVPLTGVGNRQVNDAAHLVDADKVDDCRLLESHSAGHDGFVSPAVEPK